MCSKVVAAAHLSALPTVRQKQKRHSTHSNIQVPFCVQMGVLVQEQVCGSKQQHALWLSPLSTLTLNSPSGVLVSESLSLLSSELEPSSSDNDLDAGFTGTFFFRAIGGPCIVA